MNKILRRFSITSTTTLICLQARTELSDGLPLDITNLESALKRSLPISYMQVITDQKTDLQELDRDIPGLNAITHVIN